MEFQITMDPFMDFIFRMFIIGANIVVWTMIAVWIQVEIKSWFPKKDEVKEDTVSYEELRTYAEKDLGHTVNIFNHDGAYISEALKDAQITAEEAVQAYGIAKAFEMGKITLEQAEEEWSKLNTVEPFILKFEEPGPVSAYPIINLPEENDEVNHRRH